jgi:hypothetical protein
MAGLPGPTFNGVMQRQTARRITANDSVFILALLDNSLQRAADANTVTTHNTRGALARFIQNSAFNFSLYLSPT